MIVKVKLEDRIMMFGDSYKDWIDQVDEFMHRCAKDIKCPPVTVESSKSKWIGWGGLKWCNEDVFQQQLNREGCQSADADNPKPRQYNTMIFNQDNKRMKLVVKAWESGQRMYKINQLNDEDYALYNKGLLKV